MGHISIDSTDLELLIGTIRVANKVLDQVAPEGLDRTRLEVLTAKLEIMKAEHELKSRQIESDQDDNEDKPQLH